MLKRVFLFVMTNILVMATLSILWGLLSAFTPLGGMLSRSGFDLPSLAILCLFWGFGGAFISLLLSRWIAKRSTGAVVIDPERATGEERWLLQTVYRLAQSAGVTSMPQVAIYPSLELNAFATGATKNSALVAVSAGLMQKMGHDELEGVLGHELSHVGNGDMVTMTLIQGVVNAFVMFLSYLISMIVMQALRGRDDERREGFGDMMLRMMIHQALQAGLMFGAYILVIAPFSRWREFRADKGGAEKAGKGKMIAALEALKRLTQAQLPQAQGQAAPALEAFKINGGASLFSTHPPLDERIARLRQL